MWCLDCGNKVSRKGIIRCKSCYGKQRKDKMLPKEEKERKNNLKYKYGISIEDYDRMYSKQKGKCAICGTHQSEVNKRLFVDHNHTTGKVRSLLCSKCNFSLGHYEQNKNAFENYLIKYDVVAVIEEEEEWNKNK